MLAACISDNHCHMVMIVDIDGSILNFNSLYFIYLFLFSVLSIGQLKHSGVMTIQWFSSVARLE